MLHGTIGSSVASRRPFGDPNWRHGTQCVLLPRPAAGSGGPQPRGQRGWQRGTHSTGAISGQLGPLPSTSALRRQARWGDSGHTPRCRGGEAAARAGPGSLPSFGETAVDDAGDVYWLDGGMPERSHPARKDKVSKWLTVVNSVDSKHDERVLGWATSGRRRPC